MVLLYRGAAQLGQSDLRDRERGDHTAAVLFYRKSRFRQKEIHQPRQDRTSDLARRLFCTFSPDPDLC